MGRELEKRAFLMRQVGVDRFDLAGLDDAERKRQAALPGRAPHDFARTTKALDEVRREHWNELRGSGSGTA